MKLRSRLFAAAAAVAMAACGVSGSGDFGTATRTVTDFDRVEVEDNVRMVLDVDRFAPAGEVTLTLTGDDNLLPYVHTWVSKGTLFVGTDGVLWNDLELRVSATVDHLGSAAAYDDGYLYADGLHGARFDARADDVARVVLAGHVDRLDVDAHDAARVDAADLRTEEVWVDVDDTARVDVCADQWVRGDVEPMAGIDVYCDPIVVDVDGGLFY